MNLPKVEESAVARIRALKPGLVALPVRAEASCSMKTAKRKNLSAALIS